MKRSHRILLTVLLFITFLLSAFTLGLLLYNQKAIPKIGPPGKDGTVNYAEIDKYIDAAIAALPKAQDGKDAVVDYDALQAYIVAKIAAIPKPKDGINGTNGINGTSCTTTQTETGATINCGDGTSSTVNNGANGQDGSDGYIELRCNEKKNQWEVRYSTDTNWSLLNNKQTKCTPQGVTL